MKKSQPRWRHVNQFQPPKHRRLLLFAPELRGRDGPMDDGVRFGYWTGKGLAALGYKSPARRGPDSIFFHRWWAYPLPPALPEAPKLVLTGEMKLALDKLERWKNSKGWGPFVIVPHKQLDVKLGTLEALRRRGLVRRGPGGYYTDLK